jgi:hypothetical protein
MDPQHPRSFAPLPGRTDDTSAMFEQCLTDLIDLLGVARPPLTSDTFRSHWEWQHKARRVIGEAVRRLPVREEWFEPLVRAAIYDPNPSFSRQLVEPALAAFGRRQVKSALLDYLRTGTNPERAGAARAWYWTGVSIKYIAGTRTMTPESKAEYDAVADLRRGWQETALQVFVTNEDLDVRRCILPGLNLRIQEHSEALRRTVEAAIHIARTHPDEYLRHRVEHQV